MGEALERDRVAVSDERLHRLREGKELSHAFPGLSSPVRYANA
jgi:hypothetical protein